MMQPLINAARAVAAIRELPLGGGYNGADVQAAKRATVAALKAIDAPVKRPAWPLWLVVGYMDGNYSVKTFSYELRAPNACRAWSRACAMLRLENIGRADERRDATEIVTRKLEA